MGYRAVALSSVDGSLGEDIGRDLAQKLGFGYLNEAIVVQVANEKGVDPETVADAERRKPFFARVAEMAALGASAGVAMPDPSLYVFDQGDSVLSMIRAVVWEAAERGNVVLVAHAACYACADRTDVLRVCVTAPFATRAVRFARARGISEADAVKSLRRSDAGRASYLKKVYGVDTESPADYDLVVNTDRLSPETVVGLVLGLL
jgi:hypothetical protein